MNYQENVEDSDSSSDKHHTSEKRKDKDISRHRGRERSTKRRNFLISHDNRKNHSVTDTSPDEGRKTKRHHNRYGSVSSSQSNPLSENEFANAKITAKRESRDNKQERTNRHRESRHKNRHYDRRDDYDRRVNEKRSHRKLYRSSSFASDSSEIAVSGESVNEVGGRRHRYRNSSSSSMGDRKKKISASKLKNNRRYDDKRIRERKSSEHRSTRRRGGGSDKSDESDYQEHVFRGEESRRQKFSNKGRRDDGDNLIGIKYKKNNKTHSKRNISSSNPSSEQSDDKSHYKNRGDYSTYERRKNKSNNIDYEKKNYEDTRYESNRNLEIKKEITTNRADLDELINSISAITFDDKGCLIDFVKNFYFPHPAVEKMKYEEAEDIRKKKHINILHPKNTYEIPNPVLSFEQAAFPESLTELLEIKFKAPTAVQSQGWPIALSGYDLIANAETGSGKTLAYILPALIHTGAQPPVLAGQGPVVLVVAPTRELADQIGLETTLFSNKVKKRVVTVYGQVERVDLIKKKLREGVDIVVGCPGKLMDFIKIGILSLRRVTYFVLDEADRLLDMGFKPQILAINRAVRPDRQLLLWSATWPSEVECLMHEVLPCKKDYFHIRIGDAGKAVDTIQQTFHFSQDIVEKKEAFFTYMMNEGYKNLTLVFCNTKLTVDRLVMESPNMTNGHVYAAKLHGGMAQVDRKSALESFKNKHKNCLIATEVASRGLDIPNIYEVINYDCPLTVTDYIHRIGRTARAGRQGKSLTYITSSDTWSCSSFMNEIPECLAKNKQECPEFLLETSRPSQDLSYTDINFTEPSSVIVDWNQETFCWNNESENVRENNTTSTM